MSKALRAITAGVVSTTVMVVVLFLADVETRSRLSLFDAMARFVGMPGNVAVGFLLFLFVGIVVWPLLFALADPHLPPKHDSAVSGMLFAVAVWVAFVLTGTTEIHVILALFYAVVTLLAHLAYGFTLGLVYGWMEPAATAQTVVGPEPNGENE